jgi:hypothetical protein
MPPITIPMTIKVAALWSANNVGVLSRRPPSLTTPAAPKKFQHPKKWKVNVLVSSAASIPSRLIQDAVTPWQMR